MQPIEPNKHPGETADMPRLGQMPMDDLGTLGHSDCHRLGRQWCLPSRSPNMHAVRIAPGLLSCEQGTLWGTCL